MAVPICPQVQKPALQYMDHTKLVHARAQFVTIQIRLDAHADALHQLSSPFATRDYSSRRLAAILGMRLVSRFYFCFWFLFKYGPQSGQNPTLNTMMQFGIYIYIYELPSVYNDPIQSTRFDSGFVHFRDPIRIVGLTTPRVE